MENQRKMAKNSISTSQSSNQHPFAGQNIQNTVNQKMLPSGWQNVWFQLLPFQRMDFHREWYQDCPGDRSSFQRSGYSSVDPKATLQSWWGKRFFGGLEVQTSFLHQKIKSPENTPSFGLNKRWIFFFHVSVNANTAKMWFKSKCSISQKLIAANFFGE